MSKPRGTTNSNARGSAADRLARKVWLLATFSKHLGPDRAKCAFRGCQTILTIETVTVDRYPVPGILGGRYVRGNIRPACALHNYGEGGKIARKAAKARRRQVAGMKWAYRAGWPATGSRPRAGRLWLRVGPWVVGDVARWDESGAP